MFLSMQKSKKIEVYLKKHPRATKRDLEKKFRLSPGEGDVYFGEEDVSLREGSVLMSIYQWFSHEARVLWALFALALLVRSVYAFFVLRDPLLTVPLHDAKYYLLWAQDILEHGWLGDTVFFTEPLYAYLLAFILKFFGQGGTTALLILQWLAGALVTVGLYLVTKKMFGKQAGLITGVLAALFGPFIFYEGLLLKTSLEVALLPWLLLALFWAFEKRDTRSFFLVGMFLGLLSLVKGNNLIFVPAIISLLWYLFHLELTVLKRVSLTVVFVIGVALFILPVTVRNYAVGHDIVLTNYSFGLVAYQGSWWGGDGSTALVPPFLRPDPAYEEIDAVGMAEAYAEKELKPSEVSSFWLSKAIEEATADPTHFLGSLLNKVLILFNHSEFSDNYQFGWYRSQVFLLWLLPNFSFVCLFGLLGMALLFSKHFWSTVAPGLTTPLRKHVFSSDQALILVTLFLSSIAVLLLTTVNARYRVALVPFLLIFSSGALIYLWECIRENRGSRLLALGGGVFLIVLLLWYPLRLLRFDTGAQSYHALGYEALLSGQYQEARELFDQAIVTDPEYAWAYGNLALVALAEGQYEEAERSLKKLIVLRSDDLSNYRLLILLKSLKAVSLEEQVRQVEEYVKKDKFPEYDASFNEAERFRSRGDEARARDLYERSLLLRPENPATLLALASLSKKQGRVDEAKKYLKQAVESHPEVFPARYNLANIYIEEQNFALVAELLRDIYEFTPELGDTWYNYAVALIKLNNGAEAVPVMQAYIDRYQDDLARKNIVEKFRSALKPAKTNELDALLKQQQGK
jgi:tetratricopeptide (TPR) repeat protein